MKLTTIIFDLGGVLINWDPMRVYRKVFQDEAKAQWFIDHICTLDWNEMQDGGRSIAEAEAELLAKFPEWKSEILDYYGRWEEMLDGSISETVEIFKALKASKKYPIYALTNWSAETFPRALQIFDFLHWFDGVVVSGEEKTRKPHAVFYQILLDRYNVKAEECVFIDDNFRNILAARAMGITSIHFQTSAQVRAELVALGMLEA